MEADKKIQDEIMAVMDAFCSAYEQRDMAAVLDCMARDDDVITFGAGDDERSQGLEELKEQLARDWSESDEATLEIGKHSVSCAGCCAWIAALAVIHVRLDDEVFDYDTRLTAVFEKRGDKWLIMHWHLSLPVIDEHEEWEDEEE